MDAILRPHDLGSTQWYVLWFLFHEGPQIQRDLQGKLNVEKATLSGVIAALVRKGLIEQSAGVNDRRQKLLTLTPAGSALWQQLPDPIEIILTTAFEGIPDADLETTVRVLSTATGRLQDHLAKGEDK